MSEAREQLRASVQEQQKKTDELIRSTKGIQRELRAALSSAEAALKEGALLQEKLKKQQPKLREDAISKHDKERIAKLLGFIEKEVGPKPNTESLIEALQEDAVIERIAKGKDTKEGERTLGHVPQNASFKKGHIAL